MKALAAVVFGLILAAAGPALAAEQPTLQKEASRKVSQTDDTGFITLDVENDMFGSDNDRNYTSGVRLVYSKVNAAMPETVRHIANMVPTFSINPTTTVYYSLGQNLYTPHDITVANHIAGDRPYAAFLYGSAGLSTITDNHIDDLEMTLGVVGPAALGEQTQKFVHHVVDSPQPQGWSHQLRNEPGLILAWDRRWPERFSFKTLGWTGAVQPHAGLTLGNVYIYATTGLGFRLSPSHGRWQDDPVRVRPAMPGGGSFFVDDGRFAWYLFGGVDGRAVARNIFLDGNTFADSYDVNKKTFVLDASGGVALTYGRTRLSYAITYRTKEFYGSPGTGDVFGTVSLGYRF